ncbi:uncharacterized protein LOC135302957 [Passer domesticus]|uniref:uncharacterized protein LOC135302957 n=1 Tax=Passer domesticus TaxID=48849 RepID=UPI0030FE39D4
MVKQTNNNSGTNTKQNANPVPALSATGAFLSVQFRSQPLGALLAPGGRGRCGDSPAPAGGAVARAEGARAHGGRAEWRQCAAAGARSSGWNSRAGSPRQQARGSRNSTAVADGEESCFWGGRVLIRSQCNGRSYEQSSTHRSRQQETEPHSCGEFFLQRLQPPSLPNARKFSEAPYQGAARGGCPTLQGQGSQKLRITTGQAEVSQTRVSQHQYKISREALARVISCN